MKALLSIALTCFAFGAFAQSTDTNQSFDSNYVHTVYFWLNEPSNPQDCALFETSLTKFLQNSNYAKTKFIGKAPKASRDVVDGSFTYSLVVTFESAEAQQAYQDEAAHKLFIEEASGLWKKVIVYDSIPIDTLSKN